MYNEAIIGFGFCNIKNNQGLSKSYEPQTSALVENPYLTLIILDYT